MKKICFAASLVLLLVFSGCKKEIRVEQSEIEVKDKLLFLEGNKFSGVAYKNFTNGKLQSEWTIVDGVAHGPSSTYYSNGQLNEKLDWNEGKRNGPYEKY